MATISGVHHLKIPVSDVARSRTWYERVLGFEVTIEFVEDGLLLGVAMSDPDRTTQLALRHDPDRARALSGFDPIALAVPTRSDVTSWREHLDVLGEDHDGIVTGHQGGSVLVGMHDPDGIEVRLYAD